MEEVLKNQIRIEKKLDDNALIIEDKISDMLRIPISSNILTQDKDEINDSKKPRPSVKQRQICYNGSSLTAEKLCFRKSWIGDHKPRLSIMPKGSGWQKLEGITYSIT